MLPKYCIILFFPYDLMNHCSCLLLGFQDGNDQNDQKDGRIVCMRKIM